MFFNLLSNSTSIIQNNVFEDIKLIELFNMYFSKEQTDNIISVLRNPTCAEDIKPRQELFLELERDEI